jgi:hypothetical protein
MTRVILNFHTRACQKCHLKLVRYLSTDSLYIVSNHTYTNRYHNRWQHWAINFSLTRIQCRSECDEQHEKCTNSFESISTPRVNFVAYLTSPYLCGRCYFLT